MTGTEFQGAVTVLEHCRIRHKVEGNICDIFFDSNFDLSLTKPALEKLLVKGAEALHEMA
jgi:hypothetical protein